MAGPTRSSATAFAVESAIVSVLRDSKDLIAARDVETLTARAAVLLQNLVPGIAVTHYRGAPRSGGMASAPRALLIPVSEGDSLLVHIPVDTAGAAVLPIAAELIGQHAAALHERLRLADAVGHLKRNARIGSALYAIANRASASGRSLEHVFRVLHRIVGRLIYAANFYIVRYDAVREQVRFVYYVDSVDTAPPAPESEYPLATIASSPTWHVLRRGCPLRGSMGEISAQLGVPVSVTGPAPRDWLGVPLLEDQDVTGCIVVQSYDDMHHYTAADQLLLSFVAQHVTVALQRHARRRELEERVTRRTRTLRAVNQALQREVRMREQGEQLQRALFEVAELTNSTRCIDDFFAATHRVVGELLYARNYCVALLSDDGSLLTFPYWVDERRGDYRARATSDQGGLTEYVVQRAAPLLADASQIEDLRARGVIKDGGKGAVHWLGVPLVCGGRTLGALVVQSYSEERHYTVRDQQLLSFVSTHIAQALVRVRTNASLQQALEELEARVTARTEELARANRELRAEITERRQIQARLAHAASHDALTGLPNRVVFLDRLTAALRRYRRHAKSRCAVLFVDLDHFKKVNDSEGHLIGDELLIAAGSRIRASIKATDLVARLGGDEFGVLLEGVSGVTEMGRIAARVVQDLREPFRIKSTDLAVSASVGAALADATYDMPEDLLRAADRAMYQAKAAGRDRCTCVGSD